MAIAIGIRMGSLDRWTVFRLSWHFGFAQFGMPIVGWYAGGYLSGAIGQWGKWAAAAILFVIGIRLIGEQFQKEESLFRGDPTRGLSLIALMFATSVDVLAAGFSLALVGTQILTPSLIIGIVAAGMTIIGLAFGRAFGLKMSRTAGIVGGVILLILAAKTVL